MDSNDSSVIIFRLFAKIEGVLTNFQSKIWHGGDTKSAAIIMLSRCDSSPDEVSRTKYKASSFFLITLLTWFQSESLHDMTHKRLDLINTRLNCSF